MNAVDELRGELAVAAAAAAARGGDLERAAELLAETGGVAGWDLLARVEAQLGRWEEADACWARVQELEPDHVGAARGRKVVAGIVAGRRRARPLAQPPLLAAAALVVTGAVVAGAVVGVAAVVDDRVVAASPSVSPSADPRLAEQKRRADELQRQLDEQAAARRAAAARLNQQLDALTASVRVPGVIVSRQGGSVRVLFQRGLFSRGTSLTPDGLESLASVSTTLPRSGATITIVGHSVPTNGSERGGSGTALARARVAAQELSEVTGLPLTSFTLTTADQSAGPFREPARNRTISLVLTPVG
ncbi:type VI secretion system protein ImpK [Kribbella antiqua]|uniref:Type VI secretion system protein ImpK n=1 Tax=Kribbella antiqua TaxID=2512217 RepID=A0A4R2IPD3_9ACTN|nr:tetratricopeptide repeat protein [Kribbella antiqua]TCO46787.1 type VI secretion system protein ImpK [Kribbella antiqua]